MNSSLSLEQIRKFIVANLGVASSDLQYMNEKQVMEIYAELFDGLQKAKQNEKYLDPGTNNKSLIIPQSNCKNPQVSLKQAKTKRPTQSPIIIDEFELPNQIKKHKVQQAPYQKNQKPKEIKKYYSLQKAVNCAHNFDNKYRIIKELCNQNQDESLTETVLKGRIGRFSEKKRDYIRKLLIDTHPKLFNKQVSINQLFPLLKEVCDQFIRQKSDFQLFQPQMKQISFTINIKNDNKYQNGIKRNSLQKTRKIKNYNKNNSQQKDRRQFLQQKKCQKALNIEEGIKQSLPVIVHSQFTQQILYSDQSDDESDSLWKRDKSAKMEEISEMNLPQKSKEKESIYSYEIIVRKIKTLKKLCDQFLKISLEDEIALENQAQ